MGKKIITEELKKQIINFYLSKPMTLKEVGEKFSLSNPTIIKILKEVPRYSRAQINNPNLNEDLFQDINDEYSAYFLGLLISDGNVYINEEDGRQASISITLQEQDKYILESFKEVLKVNTKISFDNRGSCQLAVRSNKMAEDLSKFGIVPRKSFITYLPKIKEEFMPHLVRGIFDGDGSIIAKINDKTNRFIHAISFCGSFDLMTDISNYCDEILKLNQKPNVYSYKDRQLSEIKLQNIKDIYKIGEWMYKDCTIYLKRKKDIYLDFKNHYNLN